MKKRAAWALAVSLVVGVGGYLLFLPQDCTAKTDSKSMDIAPQEMYIGCSTPSGKTLRLPFDDDAGSYSNGDVTGPSQHWFLTITAGVGLLSGLVTYLVMWLRTGGVDTLLAESDAGYGRTGETRL